MKRRFLALPLVLFVALVSGCAPYSQAEKSAAESACALVIGSYNAWKVVPTGLSDTRKLAYDHLIQNLQMASVTAQELYSVEELGKLVTENISKTEYSPIEIFAGMISVRLENLSLEKLDDERFRWQPGDGLSVDRSFKSKIIERCGEVTSRATAVPESKDPALPETQSWPPAGYDVQSEGLVSRIVEHDIDCDAGCGGLTWEFIARDGCPVELSVTGSFVDDSGKSYDVMTDVAKNVKPMQPVLIEIFSYVDEPDIGIALEDITCR